MFPPLVLTPTNNAANAPDAPDTGTRIGSTIAIAGPCALLAGLAAGIVDGTFRFTSALAPHDPQTRRRQKRSSLPLPHRARDDDDLALGEAALRRVGGGVHGGDVDDELRAVLGEVETVDGEVQECHHARDRDAPRGCVVGARLEDDGAKRGRGVVHAAWLSLRSEIERRRLQNRHNRGIQIEKG